MASERLAEQVAVSTTASRVPLRIEDEQAAKVVAEAFRPSAARPSPALRREAA